MRNIRQNLVLAFVYNSIGIPIAAGLLYPFTGWLLSPMIAAAAMAASSLSVVGNANRLRCWRARPLPATSAPTSDPAVETPDDHPDTADTPVGHADSTVEHTDPVCGMTVEPATAATTATHGGRTYAFCFTGCHQAFTTDPDQYLLAGTN